MKLRKWCKPALLMALAALLIMGLTACGQKAKEEPKSQQPPEQKQAAPAPAPAKVVKIGFMGPLTGANAQQGTGARNAFELAIKQANDSGKYSYKIEPMSMDDASTPGTGASAALKITSDEAVVAAVGHWNSPVAEATIPVFKKAGISLVLWGAISPTLTSKENYPIVTRVVPTSVQENAPFAKFLMDTQGIKKWAIISDTTVYGKNNTEAWKAEVAKRSGEVVSVDEIQVGQADFRPILTKIKNLKPQAIYFGGVVMEGALIRKQMSEAGIKVPFAAISGIVEDKFIEVAGAKIAEGTVSTVAGSGIEKMPGGPQFLKAYESAGFKEPPGAYAPYAYEGANVVLAALKETGPDRAKLTEKITKIDYTGVIGRTAFDAVGQTTNAVVTIQVAQDGKWVAWDDSEYKSGKRSLPK